MWTKIKSMFTNKASPSNKELHRIIKEQMNLVENLLQECEQDNNNYRRWYKAIGELLQHTLRNTNDNEYEIIYKFTELLLASSESDLIVYGKIFHDGFQPQVIYYAYNGTPRYNLPLGTVFPFSYILNSSKSRLERGTIVSMSVEATDNTDIAKFSGWGVKSLTAIPVVGSTSLLGIFGIINYDAVRTWSRLEKDLLNIYGNVASGFLRFKIRRDRYENRKRIIDYLIEPLGLYCWSKDSEGRYTYIEKRWLRRFYPGMYEGVDLLTINDIEAITRFRAIHGEVGDSKLAHEFGEICRGSDEIVINLDKGTQTPKCYYFIEVGAILGEDVLLFVIKKLLIADDKVLTGISGCAYDFSTRMTRSELNTWCTDQVKQGHLILENDHQVWRFVNDNTAKAFLNKLMLSI